MRDTRRPGAFADQRRYFVRTELLANLEDTIARHFMEAELDSQSIDDHGRNSGKRRTTPVAVIVFQGERYLVAGFDSSNWVKNARVAGRGELRRGRKIGRCEIGRGAAGKKG